VIGPDDEHVHPPAGAAFGESVTFAWGDLGRDLYGSARLGLGADGTASALALLFADGRPAAVGAAGGEAIEAPTWERLAAGGVTVTVEEPLRAWTATFDAAEGGFDLRFEALSPPLEVALGGTEGYEQLCRVTGTVRVGDATHEIETRGQRGHAWGASDWKGLELSRAVGAWWDDERAITLAAVRPAGAKGHEAEEVAAWFVTPGDEDADAALVSIEEARLSTAYDGAGHQRRAGLELWPDAEATFPLRAAGEVVCGTSLELGRLRLDASFFRWRMGGREGVGRYDVLRRAS
jgi:hypothetical protein